ncbi:hypothetical protein [Solimonas flava]|uniref:hypothetical protein n=1 Tax=Solimonas flava TaxID=415849 RepID=UPI000489AB95|nr:hypothetical protein [Solimonas flava]
MLDPTESVLKEQLNALKLRKAEATAELERCKLLAQAAMVQPTPEKIARFADGLRQRLTEGEVPLRKAYLRAFVDLIVVEDNQIIIQGRKDVLVSAAAKGKVSPAGAVLTFVPKWRARQDSNL